MDSTKKALCEGTPGNRYDAGTDLCTTGSELGIFQQGGMFDSVVNLLLFISVIISGLFLIIGGIRYSTSSGDQQQVESAKKTIQYAIVGLVVSFLALGIVTFVGNSLDNNTTPPAAPTNSGPQI